MTPDEERLRALVEVAADPANKIPPSWWASFGRECADVLPAALAEIDRLRALPVIATCGECPAHAEVGDEGPNGADRIGYVCGQHEDLRATAPGDTPPSWCPLRGVAEDAIKRGLHVARHDRNASHGRPYVQIRDGSDVALWDGWWTVEERAYAWREAWPAARWRP